jgi:hypothetical protein
MKQTELIRKLETAEARHRTISAAIRAIDAEIAANHDLAKKLESRHPQ